MAETDPALIGRHPCGCITLAIARPDDDWSSDDDKAVAKIVKDGGEVIRTTVGEARAMPHFLVSECPHDPRGWERTPPEPKITLRAGYRCWKVSRDYRTIGTVNRSGERWWVRPFGAERPLADGGHRTRREAVAALCDAVPVEEAPDA